MGKVDVEKYIPLLEMLAKKTFKELDGIVEYGDLYGYGAIGLMDAAQKFDPTRNVKFKTFASHRIKGAIYDGLRQMDWCPRTIRQRQKKLTEAMKNYGNDVSVLAREFNVPEATMKLWVKESDQIQCVSWEGIQESEQDELDNKSDLLWDIIAFKNDLIPCLKVLTLKEKEVIWRYYYQNETLKEIAKRMGVSESRTDQLKLAAEDKLRKALGYENVKRKQTKRARIHRKGEQR